MTRTDPHKQPESRKSIEKKNKKEKKKKKNKNKKKKSKEIDIGIIREGNNALSVSIAPNIVAAATIVDSTQATSNSSWSWRTVFDAAANVPQQHLDEEFLQRTSLQDCKNDENTSFLSEVVSEFQDSSVREKKAIYQDDTDKILPNDNMLKDEHSISSLGLQDIQREEKIRNSSRKKKKRKRENETDKVLHISEARKSEDVIAEDNPQNNQAALEGEMIALPSSPKDESEMIMVLIDREKGIIFSALDQVKDGSRRIVGKIVPNAKNGEIQFDPQFLALRNNGSEVNNDHLESNFPYPTDSDDHCESPTNAYLDIVPLLNKIAEVNSVSSKELAIYDPYYCNGSVIENLASLGFSNVYNRKEDCYAKWESKSAPKCEIFCTNPPYSEDHIPKLFNYLMKDTAMLGKPWFLLMPTWVHKKDYYVEALRKANGSIQPFYIVPKKRYIYVPPKNFRDKKKSDVHKKSSPFVSMWYIWGGDHERNESLMQIFQKHNGKNKQATCELARSKSGLRDLRRKGGRNK
eukprot:CAMPEP_0197831726 /NCGR_PEP_ID=MMETSP1437-20131217/11733_1 /TAXON_ID=49252 ORGANISM="Eucampia antarctica, Strain CCMP1452" /NCGR_SAMPLE_ID=MMETSP1437 /ASSEMBLY_ACC=CAM_ASM_001096 /LENGTH=519 /DNA_ID=CAMNT_0043434763 /DNA_START=15 /DNA_END=1574 /DNA_ORIENTATION=+